MKQPTYEMLRAQPELLEALLRQAHHERAEAVHRLIVAPVARLLGPVEWGHVQGRAAQG